jgi:hypothetical protein
MELESDPDTAWVAELSMSSGEESRTAVDEARNERALSGYLVRQHRAAGRASYIEIDAPLELHALVRLLRPDHVVEIGVSSGVSSAYLLNALAKNGSGRLHSVDLPSFEVPRLGRRTQASWSLPPGKGPGWAVPPRLRTRWDLRLGDKADVLPLLAEQLPGIDLLLYDVPHRDSVVRAELRSLDHLLPANAVVIIDHGPGGELCSALNSWAREHGGRPVGRAGLGLYGARKARRTTHR